MIELATMIITGASAAIDLAVKAIDAFQVGDEARAFRLLDEAIAASDKALPELRAQLEAVKARVAEAIAKKFDGGA